MPGRRKRPASIRLSPWRRSAPTRPGPSLCTGAWPTSLTGKEERQPGPKHIAEVAGLVSDQVKCIFGGAGGKFLPDELRRGALGNMPACELADVLTKITELWWDGRAEDARAMHRRLLPLINLENHPFMRYILKRRGVFSTLVERAPAGKLALDEGDRREIATLLQTVARDIDSFPILPAD